MPSSERDQILQQALSDRQLHRALLDQLDEGIYMVDRERRILYWNAAAERISGYAAREVTGRLCHGDLMMHCDAAGTVLCGQGCPLTGVMLDASPRQCTVFLRHQRGHRVPVYVRSRAIHDSQGGVIGAVEMFREVRAPARPTIWALQPFGCVDEVTGAAKRKYGVMRVEQSLEALNAFGIHFGWLRIVLDDAEPLEQRYGPDILDAALKLIAWTLEGNLGSLDLLTRWSRTQLRVEVHSGAGAGLAEIAEKLVILVRASTLDWRGQRLRVTASIAGRMAEQGDTLESLEQRVGEAFENCLANGGDRAAIAGCRGQTLNGFSPGMPLRPNRSCTDILPAANRERT